MLTTSRKDQITMDTSLLVRRLLLPALLLLVITGCSFFGVDFGVPASSVVSLPAASSRTPPPLGARSKTSGCQVNGKYPDPSCTPGAVLNVSASDVCTSGYSQSVRNVPESEKNQVYAEYGITIRATGQYEVDHFISLELGGSNDIANLWPESADPRPGFHEKDKVENYLHGQVCGGATTLQEAQREISTDWYAVYRRLGN